VLCSDRAAPVSPKYIAGELPRTGDATGKQDTLRENRTGEIELGKQNCDNRTAAHATTTGDATSKQGTGS